MTVQTVQTKQDKPMHRQNCRLRLRRQTRCLSNWQLLGWLLLLPVWSLSAWSAQAAPEGKGSDPLGKVERLLFGGAEQRALPASQPWPPATPAELAVCRHPWGSQRAGAEQRRWLLPVGEHLQYRMDMGGIGAAEWSFQSVRLGKVNGQPAHDVRSELRFDPLVTAWLPLHVQAVALLPQASWFASSAATTVELGEKRLQERFQLQSAKTTLHWQALIHQASGKRPNKLTGHVPGVVMDPLSAFYRLRHLPTEGEHCLLLASSRRIWTIWLTAMGQESITTAVGIRSAHRYHITLGTAGMTERWHGDIWLATSEPALAYKLTLATPLPVVAGLYRYETGELGQSKEPSLSR